MAIIRITQVKSRIGATKRQKATLDTLGLTKMNQTVEVENTQTVLGMVEKVRHLVQIEQ